MNYSLNGTDKEQSFANDYDLYVNEIYRLCFSFMKNHMDAEDAVQETFMKFYRSNRTFDSESHKKAWLIVTASNCCKNMLKHWWNRRNNLEDYTEFVGSNDSEIDEMMELVMSLPEKYKTSVYLYYYEGYNSREISKIVGKPESTIRTYLQNAKKILKTELE